MKKSFIGLVSAALLTSSLFGACEYEQKGDLIVGFKAFKTPLKIGVGGEFHNVEYSNKTQSAADLQALLKGSSVLIHTSSVETGNPARDKKLVDFFFNKLVQKQISAKITDLKTDKSDAKSKALSGVVFTEIKMNNVVRPAQLKFTYEKGVFQADGVIDLADYQALGALSSINKACYDLHQGKTWSDVEISFNLTIKEECE